MEISNKFVFLLMLLILAFYVSQGLTLISNLGHPIGLCDFDFHLDKINGGPTEYTTKCYSYENADFISKMSEYPSLTHELLGRMGINNNVGLYFVFLLIVLVIPTLLFLKYVNPFAGLSYLCLMNVHLEILQATLPQAVIVILFLLYYLRYRKDYLILGMFAILGLAIHNMAFNLFVIVLVLEIIDSFVKNENLWPLFSTGYWPKIDLSSFKILPIVFIFLIPFWLVWVCWKEIRISFFKSALLIISIFGTIFSQFRIFWVAEIILVVELGLLYQNKKDNWKMVLLLTAYLIYSLIYFSFTNYKNFFI